MTSEPIRGKKYGNLSSRMQYFSQSSLEFQIHSVLNEPEQSLANTKESVALETFVNSMFTTLGMLMGTVWPSALSMVAILRLTTAVSVKFGLPKFPPG
jgi:hypothetical protein